MKLPIPFEIEEKIYDLKLDKTQTLFTITTFFPLSSEEKKKVFTSMGKLKDSQFVFKSIFSDEISNEDWNKSKEQIKKRFQDELFDIK